MSLSSTIPNTIRSVRQGCALICLPRYCHPPTLWPVSHTVTGLSPIFCHRPISPVRLHTFSNPLAMGAVSFITPKSCSTFTAFRMVFAFFVWYAPWSSPCNVPKLRVVYSMPLIPSVRVAVTSGFSSAKSRGAPWRLAVSWKTGRVSSVVSPMTTGTLCLIIPAFSPAIFASVFPRNCVWSRLMFVMMDRMGLMMLVQSRRPPSPTSTTAISIPSSAKYLKAIAVVSSKNDGLRGSKNLRSFSTKSMTYCLPIHSPLMRMRSLKSTRCGDVYSPTL